MKTGFILLIVAIWLVLAFIIYKIKPKEAVDEIELNYFDAVNESLGNMKSSIEKLGNVNEKIKESAKIVKSNTDKFKNQSQFSNN